MFLAGNFLVTSSDIFVVSCKMYRLATKRSKKRADLKMQATHFAACGIVCERKVLPVSTKM